MIRLSAPDMRTRMYLVLAMTILTMLFANACKGKPDQRESANINSDVVVETTIEEPVEPETATISGEIDKQASANVKSVPEKKDSPPTEKPAPPKKDEYKVYFLEIGSINCIPCKMMQPIMEEIAEEYKGIVKVEFYDLMVDREIGPKYRIRVMPTQVFLDANKQEFFRHEGFYPKEQLKKMLDDYLAKLSS